MHKYLLYDLDICIAECDASTIDMARQIFADRFGDIDNGPYFIEVK